MDGTGAGGGGDLFSQLFSQSDGGGKVGDTGKLLRQRHEECVGWKRSERKGAVAEWEGAG